MMPNPKPADVIQLERELHRNNIATCVQCGHLTCREALRLLNLEESTEDVGWPDH
jgi:hypothetical protein